MPRAFWLGLIVCVGVALSGALLFLRRADSTSDVQDGFAAHRQDAEHVADLDTPASSNVVRAVAVEAPTASVETPAVDQGVRVRPTSKPEPPFQDGIVEVRVVRDEDGAPLAGANVALEHAGGSETRTTDAAGMAEFTRIWDEKEVRVSTTVEGRPKVSRQSSISARSPRSFVELRPFIERQLAVHVLDASGLPFRPEDWRIDSVSAKAIGIVLTRRCGTVGSGLEVGDAPVHTTRSTGTVVSPSTWDVRVRGVGSGCVHVLFADVILGVAPIDADTRDVAVTLDPNAIDIALAPLVVHVVDDATGAGVEGALLELPGPKGKEPELRTGSDGRVTLTGPRARVADAVVLARGYALEAITIPRPLRSEVLARMRPGRRLTGLVVDRKRVPVEGTWIQHERASAAGRVVGTFTDESGRFELDNLPASEIAVVVVYRGEFGTPDLARESRTIDLRTSGVHDVEFELDLTERRVGPGR